MGRGLFPVATILLAALPFQAQAADGPSPAQKPGPHRSGFHEFRDGGPGFTAGIGTLSSLTCTIGQATQPSPYTGNQLLDCDGELPHNETTLAVDPTDPSHAIGGYHSYLLSFNGSTVIPRIVGATSVTFDGGRNWREVIPPVHPYQFTGDPALAFDSLGRAYFANIADHEGPGGSFTGPSVVVARSGDGGLSWNPPVTVARGANAVTSGKFFGPLVFNDKEFISVDTGLDSPYRDRVYVTWSRFSQFINRRRFLLKGPIMVSSSDDGDSWTVPRPVSGFSSALCPASISSPSGVCDLNQDSYPAVAPGGRIYVSFENFNTIGLNQILAVSSADGGAGWTPPSRVDLIQDLNFPRSRRGDDTLTGCQFRVSVKANTAADPTDPSGKTVYVVWADNRNGLIAPGTGDRISNTDVFLGRSSDAGETWKVIPVDTSANDQFFPWVAVAPDGRVDVGYMDRSYSAGQQECRYGFTLSRLTFDGAGNVASNTRARIDTRLSDPGHSFWFGENSAFIGDYNAVAVGPDGATWSLWTDMRAPAGPSSTAPHGQHAVGAVLP